MDTISTAKEMNRVIYTSCRIWPLIISMEMSTLARAAGCPLLSRMAT